MGTALQKAISLILSSDAELLNILKVTAQMSLKSSLLALLLGVPLGICLGNSKFPGRGLLIILNRTLMGMPPVVCGLLFYILFSGVGPLRHMKLLFTVKIMILAQVALITPIVVGAMETYVAGVSPAIRETARGLGLGRFCCCAMSASTVSSLPICWRFPDLLQRSGQCPWWAVPLPGKRM